MTNESGIPWVETRVACKGSAIPSVNHENNGYCSWCILMVHISLRSTTEDMKALRSFMIETCHGRDEMLNY